MPVIRSAYQPKLTIEIRDDHPWYQWLMKYLDDNEPTQVYPYIPIEIDGVTQNYGIREVKEHRRIPAELGIDGDAVVLPADVWVIDLVLQAIGDPANSWGTIPTQAVRDE
jgi:hypothetical protein